MKAEFIPSIDPAALHAGQALTVQLLADKKPIGDAAVTASPTRLE